jgi:hypothetical protein
MANHFKFKPGDKVICLKQYEGQFTYGKIYITKKIEKSFYKSKQYMLIVESDDVGSTDNGYYIEYFIPATELAQILYKDKL